LKHLQHFVNAIITEGDDFGYVGSCFGLPVISQGNTLDEIVQNLKEAIELHFEGENLSEIGFIDNPSIIITEFNTSIN
jgi:predicted RNase H-like HicB family nuclease